MRSLNHNIVKQTSYSELTVNQERAMNRSPCLDRTTHKRISYPPAGQATLHNLIVSSSMTLKDRQYSDPDFVVSQKRRRCDRFTAVAPGISNVNSSFFSPDAESHRSVHTLVPSIVPRNREAAASAAARWRNHNLRHSSSDPPPDVLAMMTMIAPPEEECYLLAYWALVDNYNKAVICSMGGVEAVIQAMQTFPDATGLQECGCLVLGNLACDSPGLALTVEQAGGIEQILQAAQHHPGSVVVQSAVCNALQNILALAVAPQHEAPLSSNTTTTTTSRVLETEVRTDLLHVLSHASSMVLSRNMHKTAEQLLAKILILDVNRNGESSSVATAAGRPVER